MALNGPIYVSSLFSDPCTRQAFAFRLAPRRSLPRRTYPNRAGLPGAGAILFFAPLLGVLDFEIDVVWVLDLPVVIALELVCPDRIVLYNVVEVVEELPVCV